MALVNVLELTLFSSSTVTLLSPLLVTFILFVCNSCVNCCSRSLWLIESANCNSASDPPFSSTPCSIPLNEIRAKDKSASMIGMTIKAL